MTLPLQDPQLAVETGGQPSTRTGFFRTVLRERKAAVVGLSIIVFFVLLSIVAPYISPYSITQQTCAVFAPPSGAHWLGCDDGGIDMLSELMQGGRISLVVGFAATLQFLGLGNSGELMWGTMLYNAQQASALEAGNAWWALAPGAAVALLGSGFALLNYAFDEIGNPALRPVRRRRKRRARASA